MPKKKSQPQSEYLTHLPRTAILLQLNCDSNSNFTPPQVNSLPLKCLTCKSVHVI